MGQDTCIKKYVKTTFPPQLVKPYKHKDKNDRTWSKAIINMPLGLVIDDLDVTGYSIDVFLNEYQESKIANNENVTFGFSEENTVSMFYRKGEDRKQLEVNPWSLTKAIKAMREELAEEKRLASSAQTLS
jgi:hypoxanthine phosphoribosyltransferase